jgi:hypothetical protein
MPLLIRELNIKVNVGPAASEGGAARGPAAPAGGGQKSPDAAAVQRAVEEMLRIESERKER